MWLSQRVADKVQDGCGVHLVNVSCHSDELHRPLTSIRVRARQATRAIRPIVFLQGNGSRPKANIYGPSPTAYRYVKNVNCVRCIVRFVSFTYKSILANEYTNHYRAYSCYYRGGSFNGFVFRIVSLLFWGRFLYTFSTTSS